MMGQRNYFEHVDGDLRRYCFLGHPQDIVAQLHSYLMAIISYR